MWNLVSGPSESEQPEKNKGQHLKIWEILQEALSFYVVKQKKGQNLKISEILYKDLPISCCEQENSNK